MRGGDQLCEKERRVVQEVERWRTLDKIPVKHRWFLSLAKNQSRITNGDTNQPDCTVCHVTQKLTRQMFIHHIDIVPSMKERGHTYVSMTYVGLHTGMIATIIF